MSLPPLISSRIHSARRLIDQISREHRRLTVDSAAFSTIFAAPEDAPSIQRTTSETGFGASACPGVFYADQSDRCSYKDLRPKPEVPRPEPPESALLLEDAKKSFRGPRLRRRAGLSLPHAAASHLRNQLSCRDQSRARARRAEPSRDGTKRFRTLSLFKAVRFGPVRGFVLGKQTRPRIRRCQSTSSNL